MAELKKPIRVIDEANLFSLCEGYRICLECGFIREGVEPDAERYQCPECRAMAVMGMEQALLCGHIEVGE